MPMDVADDADVGCGFADVAADAADVLYVDDAADELVVASAVARAVAGCC